MIFPVSKLIEEQKDLVCVKKNASVREALVLMVSNDFSQLPVVDEQGILTGIISEQSITRAYFYANNSVSLSNLPVHHCQTSPVTISPDSDVFDALGRMRNVPAIIVVQNRKPIGVVTYFDVTHFFRNVSEGLMYVEDIEVTLRGYIENIFADDEKLNEAMIHVFGQDKQNPGQPGKQYDQISFYNHMQLILHDKNWQHFDHYLQPKELFHAYMEQVRLIRNQLAHFRDELSTIQLQGLLHVRDWLASRTKPVTPKSQNHTAITSDELENFAEKVRRSTGSKGKYEPLYLWLSEQPEETEQTTASFDQIEKLIGEPLPDSARKHNAWWANDTVGHTHSQSWLNAGWRVENFDLTNGLVTFERASGVHYQLFFSDVLERLYLIQPTLVGKRNAWARHYFSFPSKVKGFDYIWAFKRKNIFQIALYCDIGNKKINKQRFDAIKAHQAKIEQKLKTTLNWERLDNYRASRIAWDHHGTISASDDELAQLKEWATAAMPLFVEALQPYVEEIGLQIQGSEFE